MSPGRGLVRSSDHHSKWFFQQALDRLEEGRSRRPIHDPVITAEGQLHDIPRNNRPIPDDRNRLDGTYRQDTGIRRIDDRRELIYAEHTHIGDGECTSFPFSRLELFTLRPLGQILHFNSDLRQALRVRKSYHRHQQPVLYRYRHPDVDMVIDPDPVAQPAAVDSRVLLQRYRHCLQHDIVEGDLYRRYLIYPGPAFD